MEFRTRRGKSIKIVPADDQAEVRQALDRYLTRDCRFEIVGQAEDGMQAVDVVISERPDVVIMDLAMPKMNGLLATRKIKETTPEIKVVILSASIPFGDTKEDATSAGADAIFDKNTPPKKLIKAIVRLLDL